MGSMLEQLIRANQGETLQNVTLFSSGLFADRFLNHITFESFSAWQKGQRGDSTIREVKALEDANEETKPITYFNPRFDVAADLCVACRTLLTADWYHKILLHSTLGALGRSASSCHLCLIAYKGLLVEVNLLIKTNKVKPDQRFYDNQIWGVQRPHASLGETHPTTGNSLRVFRLHALDFSFHDQQTTLLEQRESQELSGMFPHLVGKNLLEEEDYKYPIASLPTRYVPDQESALLAELSALKDNHTGSEVRMKLAKYWLRRCLDTHSICCKDESCEPLLPTRVIDIGPLGSENQREPRLFVTNGERAPYIALSHRWGGAKVLVSTTKNIYEHQVQIRTQDMPKTFQDAIKITRTLGFQFLWIDSLCILQDNINDWEVEAEAMGSVYQNTTLTIAAIAARSADSGCFQEYDGRQNRSCYVGTFHDEVSALHPVSQKCHISARKNPLSDGSFEKALRPRGPLDSRGWVLQEEVLSSRLLSFCEDGIYWECLNQDASEELPQGRVLEGMPEGREVENMYARNFKIAIAELAKTPSEQRHLRIYEIWDKLVENYTQRELTNEKDRLIAVAGLAKVMENATNDNYRAGLWESKLLNQLMWHVDVEYVLAEPEQIGTGLAMSRFKNILLPERRKGFLRRSVVAPSWSWAQAGYGTTWRNVSVSEPLVDILDLKVEVLAPGAVKGRLRLRGSLYTAQASAGNRIKRDVLVDPQDSSNTSTWYCCDEIDWIDGRVMCLALAKGLHEVYCLALFPTSNCFLVNPETTNAEFQRVGLSAWTIEKWQAFTRLQNKQPMLLTLDII